jgi:hypothetical protein
MVEEEERGWRQSGVFFCMFCMRMRLGLLSTEKTNF